MYIPRTEQQVAVIQRIRLGSRKLAIFLIIPFIGYAYLLVLFMIFLYIKLILVTDIFWVEFFGCIYDFANLSGCALLIYHFFDNEI